MALPLTVTIISLGDAVPTHVLVKATKGGNGIKAGAIYHPLAVNHLGKIAVSSTDKPTELVKGPQSNWHPMLNFEWYVNETLDPSDRKAANNDN